MCGAPAIDVADWQRHTDYTGAFARGQVDGSGAKKGTKPVACDYCGGRGQVIQSAGVFRLQTTCPACQGAGSVIRERCPDCGGDGLTEEHVERRVTIPAGVDRDVRVRLAGEGEPGGNGGPPGDCYVVIEIEEHPFLKRDGRDLHCEVPITFPQAALGAQVEVPTLEGKVKVKVPSGTRSGAVVRLKGKGIYDLRGVGRGDQLVKLIIETPKRVTPRERELLEELQAIADAEAGKGQAGHEERKGFLDKLREFFG
jgi:molecular chaperone DnaJ